MTSICLTIAVEAQVFATPVTESRWSVKSSAFGCQLAHEIEGFGVWKLSHQSSRSETAVLVMDKSLAAKKNLHLPATRYKITTAPPAWKPQQIPETLGEVTLAKMNADLVFSSSILTSVLKTLDKSTPVMLIAQNPKPIRIQFQPYNFKDAYKQYKSCIAQLIPFTFEQITRNTLYYQVEDKELSANNKIILDKIARYMKAEPSRILGVLIDGHSDTQADAATAEALAKNYADWVAAYLKEKGIAEDKLVVRAHGDKYPVANNFLIKDRAKNRRVTVRLEDENIRQKNAEKIAELKKQAEEKALAQSSSSSVSSVAPPPEFGDKLPIELELERMVEGQDLEKPSPSEMP
jgi:outer membrane protein OmpA-like peptidoglycan-associated protein